MTSPSNIPAGRETDARVAQAVFGLRVEPCRRRAGEYVVWPRSGTVSDEEGLSPVPAYSTDDAAALTILDAWGSDWCLRCRNGQIRCELFVPSEQWEEWGSTRALAIVQARLAAAGSGKP